MGAPGPAGEVELGKKVEGRRATREPSGKSYEEIGANLGKVKEAAAQKGMEEKVAALGKKLETLANPATVRAGGMLQLDALEKARKLFAELQQVDAAPTPVQQAAVENLQLVTPEVAERWRGIPPEVAALNAQLASAGIEEIKLH